MSLDCRPVIILKVLALQHQAQWLKGGSRRNTSNWHNVSSHLSVTGPCEWRIQPDKDDHNFSGFQFKSVPVCTLTSLFSTWELHSIGCLLTEGSLSKISITSFHSYFIYCWVLDGIKPAIRETLCMGSRMHQLRSHRPVSNDHSIIHSMSLAQN